MNRFTKHRLALAAMLAVSGAIARAETFRIVLTGDSVPGGGTITSLIAPVISNDGQIAFYGAVAGANAVFRGDGTGPLVGIAQSYAERNRMADAIEVLTTESQKRPDRLDLQMSLASFQARAGKYDPAIKDLQAALPRVEHKDPKTASELGRVIKDAQSLQHAIAAAFGYQG